MYGETTEGCDRVEMAPAITLMIRGPLAASLLELSQANGADAVERFCELALATFIEDYRAGRTAGGTKGGSDGAAG